MTEPSLLRAVAQGRYEVRGLLGEGGMATVYRVYDRRLHVERALKVLVPALSQNVSLRRRFENEASAMARLGHPNVVSVYDVGEDEGIAYLVMELIEGGSVYDYLAAYGPLPPRLAVRVCLDVLKALDAAHTLGIVHRDIKPENVLLTTSGVAKVSDFGIARMTLEDTPAMTRTGSVMGTLVFMAPEQRAGSKNLDARADLYAVGATLLALVSGAPVPDAFMCTLKPELLAEIAPELRPVLLGSLGYRPDERYASAAQMVAELEALLPTLPALPAEVPLLGARPPARHEQRPTVELSLETPPPPPGGPSGEAAPTYAEVDDIPAHPTGAPLPATAATAEADVDPLVGARAAVAAPAAASGPGRAWVAGTFGGALLLAGALGLGWQRLSPADPVLSGALTAPTSATLASSDPGSEAATPAGLVPGEQPAGSETSGADGAIAAADAATEGPPDVAGTAGGSAPAADRSAVASKSRTPIENPEAASAQSLPPPVEKDLEGGSPSVPQPVVQRPTVLPAPPSGGPSDLPARISVTGDADAVWLIAGGKRYSPGDLPPGTYAIVAGFRGGPEAPAGRLTLSAGQSAALNCDSVFQMCK